MSGIGEFISQKEEIARLNKQINMIAGFYKSFYGREIAALNKRINRLVVRECRTNKTLLDLNVDRKEARTITAAKLIKQGKVSLKDIAKTCHLGYDTVRNIVTKVNKGVY